MAQLTRGAIFEPDAATLDHLVQDLEQFHLTADQEFPEQPISAGCAVLVAAAKDLDYPVTDVLNWAAILTGLGFAVSDLIICDHYDEPGPVVTKAIRKMQSQMGFGFQNHHVAQMVFVFAGHGVWEQNQLLLDLGKVGTTHHYLPVNDLFPSELRNGVYSHTLLILDCCYSSKFTPNTNNLRENIRFAHTVKPASLARCYFDAAEFQASLNSVAPQDQLLLLTSSLQTLGNANPDTPDFGLSSYMAPHLTGTFTPQLVNHQLRYLRAQDMLAGLVPSRDVIPQINPNPSPGQLFFFRSRPNHQPAQAAAAAAVLPQGDDLLSAIINIKVTPTILNPMDRLYWPVVVPMRVTLTRGNRVAISDLVAHAQGHLSETMNAPLFITNALLVDPTVGEIISAWPASTTTEFVLISRTVELHCAYSLTPAITDPDSVKLKIRASKLRQEDNRRVEMYLAYSPVALMLFHAFGAVLSAKFQSCNITLAPRSDMANRWVDEGFREEVLAHVSQALPIRFAGAELELTVSEGSLLRPVKSVFVVPTSRPRSTNRVVSLMQHKGQPWSLTLDSRNPAAKQLYIVAETGDVSRVTYWREPNANSQLEFLFNKLDTWSILFHPQLATLFVACGKDNAIYAWSDSKPELRKVASVKFPQVLCMNPSTGLIYIASLDDGTTIHSYNPKTNELSLVIDPRKARKRTVRLHEVQGMAYDPRSNSLLLADTFAHRVCQLVLSTGRLSVVVGKTPAKGKESHADGVRSKARLNHPQGIAVHSSGTIYLSEVGADCISTLEENKVALIAGNAGESGDEEGPGLAAKFFSPTMLLLDESSQLLFITDYKNDSIKALYTGKRSHPPFESPHQHDESEEEGEVEEEGEEEGEEMEVDPPEKARAKRDRPPTAETTPASAPKRIKVTEEEHLAVEEWHRLPNKQRIMEYFPGISIHKNFDVTVVVPVLGLTGTGKSAYCESLMHIIQGLPTKDFTLQSAGNPGINSTTVGVWPITLTNAITVVDMEGYTQDIEARFAQHLQGGQPGPDSTLSDLIIHNFKTAANTILSLFSTHKRETLRFHCPILAIDFQRLNQIARYKPLVDSFKRMKERPPVVIITKCEGVKDRKKVEAEVNEKLEIQTAHCVANYRKGDTDDPTKEASVLQPLITALMLSDQLIDHKKVDVFAVGN